jgi:membrane-associated phospholipid phosphatase
VLNELPCLRRCRLGAVVLLVVIAGNAHAQTKASGSRQKPECSAEHFDRCFLDIAKDQLGIWTSPLRMRKADAIWFLPFAGATAASIYYDPETMKHVGTSTAQMNFGSTVSKYAAPYVTFGVAGGLYLIGATAHAQHLRETGLLGGEAVVDSLILAEGLKLATNRDRPYQGNGNGDFWPHGTSSINTDASLPSGHAIAIWAFARVIDREYPDRPLFKFVAYGSALTVSAARVMARDHFPSDVLVGGMFGFLTGDYVYRHHSSEYKDSFSFSVAPLWQSGPFGSRGIALSIRAPEHFQLF